MLKTVIRIALFCLALWSGSVLAQSSSGEDKALHFAGSATLAVVITAASEDPVIGFWSAVAVGLAKELVDRRRAGGDASGRDLAADVAGAFLGAQAGRWLITRRGETTAFVYALQF